MKRFQCKWNEPTYNESELITNIEYFNCNNGYSDREIKLINLLNVGEYIYFDSHKIMRVK